MRTGILITITLAMLLTAVGCGGGASSTRTASVDMIIYQVEEAVTISGTVFDDLDGDGMMDSSEIGVDGVVVALDAMEMTATDSSGNYSFPAMAGTHDVSMMLPAGYMATTPTSVQVILNEEDVVVDFGIAEVTEPITTISGTVFDDANGNGMWNSMEPGVPGVTVTLEGAGDVLTDMMGHYSFTVIAIGVYTVTETDPEGAVSTTPNTVSVDVEELGLTYQVDFGDMLMTDVDVDVKPGSDVNPINLRSNGKLPVAIMGADGFDVTLIDPSSILLQGVSPLRWSYEDVCGKYEDPHAVPMDAGMMDDEMMSPDGFMDLTLKFETQEIAAAIGEVERNDIVTLLLTGSLMDGSPISGEEMVRIVQVPKE